MLQNPGPFIQHETNILNDNTSRFFLVEVKSHPCRLVVDERVRVFGGTWLS